MRPRSRLWRRSVVDGKAAPHSPLVEENKRLTREVAHLHRKLRRTEAILDVQKKLSEILGIELPPNDYESEP